MHRVGTMLLLVALTVVPAACGSSSKTTQGLGPNPTSSDPGPNSTSFDPGPNATTNGPVTVEGTLQITKQCVRLVQKSGPLDLRFTGYTTKGATLVDDTKTAVATSGDRIAVAGHKRSTKSACGTRFDVDNLVTVLPK